MIIRRYIGLLCWLLCLPAAGLAKEDSLTLVQQWEVLPGATRIWVDAEANIWLLSPEQGQIRKYLRAWEYDSLIQIGGRSMREEGLIHPVKLALPTRQRVYVLDDVSRRLLLLTPNLKVAEAWDFQAGSARDGIWQDVYPISFAVNAAEDVFVLDGQDNRVIAFNALGEESFRFGGLDYGRGALHAPTDVLVSRTSRLILVPEPSLHQIQVFDLFGVYRYRMTPPDSLHWTRAEIFDDRLCLPLDNGCWLQSLEGRGKGQYWSFSTDEKIIDLFIQGDLLYLLLDRKIKILRLADTASPNASKD